MRREDEAKLDIISGIAGELIDKHSAIRAERLSQYNAKVKRRRIISFASMAACILLIVSALFIIISPDEPAGIVSIVRSAGDDGTDVYTITYDDGRVATFEVVNAEDESNESNITDVIHNESNELLLSLASGDTVNIGELGAEDRLHIKGATARSGGQMALKLSNDEELELGKVNNGNNGNGNGNNKNNITMAKINEGGELVLGFGSGAQINLGRVVGEKGEDGKDGVGIDGISLSESGELTITLTNGTTLNLGNIKGKDGIGIAESKINENGELVLTYTDGSVVNLGRVVGEKGEDGVGVEGIVINEQNELVFTMTDGSVVNVGNVKGEDGKSAYELYKEKFGYEGTEEEWLFDLVNGNLATKKEFTVTFDSVGGSAVPSQSVIALEYAIEPPAPTRDGYEFDGWYLDGEKWNFASLVLNKDVTLTAKWNIITYNITYHANGGAGAEGNPSQYNTETYSMLIEPNRTGYEFKGWYSDASFTTLVPAIVEGMFGELDLYAKWEIITYNITYALNGGVNGDNPDTFTVEDLPLTLAAPSREHYDFAGWKSGNTQISTISTLRNITVTAEWAPTQYEIVYHMNGGTNSNSNPETYSIETSATLAEPERAGYNFKGWYTDAAFTAPISEISAGTHGTMTLYAKWEIVTYNITYVLGEGINAANPSTFTVEDLPLNLKSATSRREHYEFVGWNDGNSTSNTLNSVGDVTFVAVWAPTQYRITYVTNGGSTPSTISYTVESADIVLRDSVRNGYKFCGWYSDEEMNTPVETIYGGSVGDITLYAKWEIITYTITYVLNDGKMVEENYVTSYQIGSNATLPSPEKDEYNFVGWATDSNNATTMTALNENMYGDLTLYAVYKSHYSYTVNGTEITITAYNGTKTELKIPSEIDGYTVTSIESRAFINCKQFTSVVIPESVEYIGEGAFSGCSGITSITIPFVGESRTAAVPNTTFGYIFGTSNYDGGECTAQCTHYAEDGALHKIDYFIPSVLSSVTVTGGKINFGAFSHIIKITSITLSDCITEIEDYAFYGCYSLAELSLPNGLTKIGDYAFANCQEFTEFTIPKTVTKIGAHAFDGMVKVKSFTVPSGVTRIEAGTFANCNRVTNIVFEGQITYFGESAFAHCYRIKSFEIPDGITEIPDSMFAVCTGLQSVKIPDSVTSIGASAFTECYELKEVTIPNGVTVIKEWSFQACWELTRIVIPDGVVTIEQSAFANCDSLQEVVLPDTLKTIGDGAFTNACYGIHVIIPGGVTEIGEHAFHDVFSVLFKEGFDADIGYDAFKNALYVYFEGTESECPQADEFDETDATVHFYSEEQPTAEGNYWHYVDGELAHWE